MKEFKGREERAEGREYKTAIIICLDDEGRIIVSNSLRHFSDRIEREATNEDVIHMCSRALDQFNVERTAQIVVKELSRLMNKAG
jgi:hypothetical protein